MAGLRPIFVTAILIGLFTVALLLFTSSFLAKNNPSSGSFNDSSVANTTASLQGSLSGAQDITNGIANVVQQDPGSPIQIFLILTSMLKIPWQFFNLLMSFITTSFVFVSSAVFGSAFSIVFSAILAIIIGTLVLLIVKFIRTGEEER